MTATGFQNGSSDQQSAVLKTIAELRATQTRWRLQASKMAAATEKSAVLKTIAELRATQTRWRLQASKMVPATDNRQF